MIKKYLDRYKVLDCKKQLIEKFGIMNYLEKKDATKDFFEYEYSIEQILGGRLYNFKGK